MTTLLSIAFLESIKVDEHRIPCHPTHFTALFKDKNKLFFQIDYGKNFGLTNTALQQSGFELAPRDQLLQEADVIFLLKPIVTDLKKMKRGAILIGWCHAVQNIAIASVAQERGLTLIAMESMVKNNKKYQNIFYENNFSAGFLGIEHALKSVPYVYKKDISISIITYGAVGQGAVTKLIEKGFSCITVYSRRSSHCIENKFLSVSYKRIKTKEDRLVLYSGEDIREKLLDCDVIVNSIMQDVLKPCYFLSLADLLRFQNKLIVDLSCDDRMGFDFTTTTTISDPIKMIGGNYYYAVDNVPSLGWERNSYFISEKLLPFFNAFLSDNGDFEILDIVSKATEIKEGVIINPVIADYQKKIRARLLS